jgi:hypothetical protein
MTCTAMIKLWRLFDDALVRDPYAYPVGKEVIERGAMQLGGPLGDRPAPVLVDHDVSRPIGFVRELSDFADTDGEWLCALVTITDPPTWLKNGTAASIATKAFERRNWGPLKRIVRGWVTEVSVLSPGVRPAEPRAKVMGLREVPPTTTPAAAAAASKSASGAAGTGSRGGEVILGGGLIVRRNVGRGTAIR